MMGQSLPGALSARNRQPAKVLIVDDDPVVRVLLRELLGDAGHDVDEAEDAAAAEQHLQRGNWDLVLLDRRLPDCDGLLLLQSVKQRCHCPVIVLTVMNDERDRMLGLGLGADDYITKPFNASEMTLRVRNLLKMTDAPVVPTGREPITLGPFTLLQPARRLELAGQVHHLTLAETRLLAVFLTRPDEALDRGLLTRLVCQREWGHDDRSIDVLVSRLRKHVEANPKLPEWIVTLHGVGYLFDSRKSDCAGAA
ncbi:MAG: response regulator transcription factor [Kiloniellales bacterium]